MTDGISIILSGTTLVAVVGLGVRVWLASRAQQVGPQPFRVAADERPVSASACEDSRRANSFDHANIFARLSEHDKAIAALQEQARNTDRKLDRIESKIDTLTTKL